LVAGIPVAYAGPQNFGAFLQYPQLDTFKGTETVIYHWYPSGDETFLNAPLPVSVAGQFEVSGPMIIFQAPTSNAIAFNLDVRVGIEYVPNDTVRALVQQCLSDVHPNAEYEMNQFVGNHWDPMVIGCKSKWEDSIQQMPQPTHDYLFSGGNPLSTSLATTMLRPRAQRMTRNLNTGNYEVMQLDNTARSRNFVTQEIVDYLT
jgi:hypothetical protein